MSADGELHPQAVAELLREVRRDVRDGFRQLRDDLRNLETRHFEERRATDQRITKEVRRLEDQIGALKEEVDVGRGEAKANARLWALGSSLVVGLLLWAITSGV